MQTILFDLDGTLVDHFTTIANSINHTERTLGLSETSADKVRATVGGGIHLTLARLLGTENAEAAYPIFQEHFEAHLFDGVFALPGAAWLLEQLHDHGDYQLAVFTNKHGPHSRAIMEHLGLDKWIKVNVGTNDTAHRKPDALFTMHILDLMEATSDETIMIGDSPFDYAAAESGCLRCYLVTTGSHNQEQLTGETAANGIYNDLFELGESLFGLTRPSA